MILKVVGILILIGLMISAWSVRRSLPGFLNAIELHILGISAGCFLLITLLMLVEVFWKKELRLSWRKRFESKGGISRPAVLRPMIATLFGKFNAILLPMFRKGLGQILLDWFQEAGFGSQPFLFIIILIGIISIGSIGGYSLTGSGLLCGFLTLFLLGIFILSLYSRAKLRRQLFQDQFPSVLDRLADSLQAGFSVSQAIEFFAPNLPEPSASEMNRVFVQLQIGFSLEQALATLYQRRPSEDVRLLVEGITLQRQVGGNLVEMIRGIAVLIRERVELENEIQTMTAQGRLSAVVIALLVPASLGLLSFIPGYTDVLFGSTIGNLVLIAAGLLEVLGAFIVIRLIRIEV